MQFFHFLFQLTEVQTVFHPVNIQPGFHDLLYGDMSEFDNPFQDIFLLFRGIIVNSMIQFFETVGSRALTSEQTFEFFRLTGQQNAQPFKEQMDDLRDAGSVKSKLQGVLAGPDLWHHFTKKYEYKTHHDHFDEKFKKPVILLEQDDLIDQKIGKNDNTDIQQDVGDQQRSQQGLRFFQQIHDPSPGTVLFCFQDIDLFITSGKERDA